MSDPVRAVQYVRMSTEQQDYSVTLQTAANSAYALAHGYNLVRTYADEALSGLNIDRREGLKRLLTDVLSGAADFSVILVYDVSRWGRFQNPDQAAHYEFLCSEAGVRVEYCAEQFSNDGTLVSVLLKNMKRVMAAEYSRDLSAKVIHAQEMLAGQGYWQGGPPGYALRRQLIRPDGSKGRILDTGDRKGPHGGRTILIPGPQDEVATVRRIYRLYLKDGLGFRAIARTLNTEAVPWQRGFPWTANVVQDVLTNEKYAGVNIIHKGRRRLGEKARRMPREEWIRTEGAFEALIDRRAFDAAQRRRARLKRRYSDEEMLEGLLRVYKRRGHLNRHIIDAAPDIPSSHHYAFRFGGLNEVYELIGYTTNWRHRTGSATLARNRFQRAARHQLSGLEPEAMLSRIKKLLAEHGRLTRELIDDALGPGAYGFGISRMGGGRRMYALAAYRPNLRQNLTFDRSRAETLTAPEAEALRQEVLAGIPHSAAWAPYASKRST